MALMSTIFKFDSQMRGLFNTIFEMSVGYASVKKMSGLLNSFTRRKGLLRQKKKRAKLMQEHLKIDPTFDSQNITISNAIATLGSEVNPLRS